MNEVSTQRMSEAMTELGTALGKVARTFVDVFSEVFKKVWDSVKGIYNSLDKQISRKRFIKILMSQGIQRNEANKIAWEVHARNKKYTLMDCVVAIRDKEE